MKEGKTFATSAFAGTEPPSKATAASENKSASGGIPTLDKLTAPQISLPKGGGAIKSIDEKFSVNTANGTLAFSVPLPVTPGRGGFQPALSLGYNSGTGNSIFGIGWALQYPAIQRRTDKQLPRYNDAQESDVFMFTGQEDLVPYLKATGNTWTPEEKTAGDFHIKRYRPRIDADSARIEKIIHQPTGSCYWKVTTKDNVVTFFGLSPSHRLTDPDDAARIFKWLPEISFDDKGNCILFTYKTENSDNVPPSLYEKNRLNGRAAFTNNYLKTVRYGNLTPYYADAEQPYAPVIPLPEEVFLFQLLFDYGEHTTNEPAESQPWNARADAFSDYRAGFEIRTHRLCKRVMLFHHFTNREFGLAENDTRVPYLVRSLDLLYQTADDTPQPLEVAYLTAITQTSYVKEGNAYRAASLPPLEFSYQPLSWNKEVKNITKENIINDPVGLSRDYRWVDLYGEGIAGILTEQAGAWYYKFNLGNGAFTNARTVAPKPSVMGFSSGTLQLQDLDANGNKQVVVQSPGLQGYFELDDDHDWRPFKSFEQIPNIDLADPNLKMLDLNGDGRAELLISEENVFTWYPSLGTQGYDAPELASKPFDEEQGPAILFADETQSIFLADMCGDGLTDIVRIRNGEICYWPNLGYGRFGAKVNMPNAPLFDSTALFNPAYLQLADISGTGATDILYLGQNRFRAWLNLGGNAWSNVCNIDPFPVTAQPSQLSVADLLGNGTSCIVWSSPLPGFADSPMRYIDLMGGKKPHILYGIKNNLGKETLIEYKSAAAFYLQDKAAGQPWITRLPFPVQCVSRVTVQDKITKVVFTNTYSYHHGYYDHAEREFRGFGRVDQQDTEQFEHWVRKDASNIVEQDLHQPPVLTRTWFHTGAFLDRQRLLTAYTSEYWPGAAVLEHALPDALLPDGLSPEELREALRACKGMVLRQETFALDGTPQEKVPYQAATHNCHIKLLQPRGQQPFAAFLVHESEAITFHYERNPAEVRVQHVLNTVIDELGNVLEVATVSYGRKTRPDGLPDEVWNAQSKVRITYAQNTFTNDVITDTAYRLRATASTRLYELTGVTAAQTYFQVTAIRQAFATAALLAYEQTPGDAPAKRLLKHARVLYNKNDLSGPLPNGTQESLGLPHTGYQLALTAALVTKVYNTPDSKVDDSMLLTAKYIRSNELKVSGLFSDTDADDEWWAPSGTVEYAANAPQHFYLPEKYVDVFGNKTTVQYYSNYHLLVGSMTDAVTNVTAVTAFDFRVLQPRLLKDSNDNITEACFNIHGWVAGLAVKGKGSEADDLDAFVTDLPAPAVADFFTDPLAHGAALLQHASSRFVYDTDRYRNTAGAQPCAVASIVREVHHKQNANSPLQYSFTYTGGMGQEVMKKVQAAPGDAWQLNIATAQKELVQNVNPRWVGNGRTLYNNKGKAVKQYEPYFAVTHTYESAQALVEIGFSPVLHYDPLGRVIQTDMPDGTFSTVVFDTWQQQSFDVNDNVKASTWYTRRLGGAMGAQEQAAAQQAAVHDHTPQQVYVDNLGRPFYTIAHNKFLDDNNQEQQGFQVTRVTLDIEGQELQHIDARGNTVVEYAYDMLGKKLYQKNMEAGRRWTFSNAAAKEAYGWDDRKHRMRVEYDGLQRPLKQWMLEDVTQNAPEKQISLTLYGEGQPDDKLHNLRGKTFRHFDQSGSVQTNNYDFKGAPLATLQLLAKEYKLVVNWNTPQPETLLESTGFAQAFSYDALGRPTQITHADGSKSTPVYDAGGLLQKMKVLLVHRNETIEFVKNITYNAKGQRETIVYDNNTATRYEYDLQTYRLMRMLTTRNAGADILQDLRYTYDPTGNVTALLDNAQPTFYFNNAVVDPHLQYVYDATYRLIKAMGREQAAQPFPGQFDNNIQPLPNGNANATQRYIQSYTYDDAGNMLSMKHQSGNGQFQLRWTRTFEYKATNNQLLHSTVNNTPPTDYLYDEHGNMRNLQNGSFNLTWNFADQLQTVNLGGGGIAYYVYDASGQRVRKVIENNGQVKERIYIGSYEVYREKQNNVISLERETLHIMDDKKRIAIAETRTQGNDAGLKDLLRYQYANHLETACLELDGAASPAIITYEEYYPFGSTAYHAARNNTETPKRYRYSGKERDEESGLYYHGARYYAPWLARWTATDPAGLVDGGNLYRYCRNNPIMLHDPQGTDPATTATPPKKEDNTFKLGPLRGTTLLSTTSSDSPEPGVTNFHGRTGFLLTLPPLKLSTTGSALGDAQVSNFGEGVANVEGRGFLTFGTVGSGLWVGTYGKGSLYVKDQGQLASGDPEAIASQVLYTGRGNLHFLTNISAGTFTLATGTTDLKLWGGHLQLDSSFASVGNLAKLRLNADAKLQPGGNGTFSANLDLNAMWMVQFGAGVKGTLLDGTGYFTGQGQLRLFGIPSLKVSATGTASTSGYDIGGTVWGYVPPLTYAWGGFSASSTGGFSARGHVFGLSYMPGVDKLKDPSPIPPIMSQQLKLPSDIEAPSGPMVGYSFFSFRQGQLSHFAVGFVPNFSDFSKSQVGLSAVGHF